jgi:hypothetical protein
MTISRKSRKAEERARLFRAATMTLASLRARKAVEAQIRARGEKVAQYSAADLREQADAYLRCHLDLVAQAAEACLTFKEFAGLDVASVCIPTVLRTRKLGRCR